MDGFCGRNCQRVLERIGSRRGKKERVRSIPEFSNSSHGPGMNVGQLFSALSDHENYLRGF